MALLKPRNIRFLNCALRTVSSFSLEPSPKVYSRGVLSSDLVINTKIQQNNKFAPKEWDSMRQELLKSKYGITETILDSTVLNICYHYKNIEAALDYFKYLHEATPQMSLFSASMFMKLFCTVHRPLTKSEKKCILDTYDNIRKQHSLLDGASAANCVSGLCLTNRWQESEELIDMMELSDSRRSTSIFSLISAAFDHNTPEIGWKYLFKYVELYPGSKVYISYLNYCKRTFLNIDKFDEEIGKMFNFWKTYKILPSKDILKVYVAVYEEFGWSSDYTTVNKNGMCLNCWHTLSPVELSDAEFKLLSDEVLNKVILGQNIYFKTTPKEIEHYLKFIEKTKPYDIVIDGLNVAYFQKNRSGMSPVSLLVHVVKHFVKQKKKVLVIGRKHMNQWPKNLMETLRKLSTVYLLSDMSQDDPFLLYTVLYSGPSTFFVSRDLMRQHCFQLENPTVQRLFKNWQASRQYMLTLNLRKEVTFKQPLLHGQYPQKDENGWHIPFWIDRMKYSNEHLEPHTESWLCLRKKAIDKNMNRQKFQEEIEKLRRSKS